MSKAARDRLLRARDSALAAGARVLAGGGRRGSGAAAGWYADPVLLENVPAAHELHRREVFDPIAVLSGAADFGEAVQAVNSGHYGPVASLHTGDLEKSTLGDRPPHRGHAAGERSDHRCSTSTFPSEGRGTPVTG
ncbi:aldehyde dehydrogenase family protein [Streptomyces sp. CNQ085]|uniref:aldehyde dehydrogenase family protein n=1 Tax=Streptomyces sp. CNQ085 TaxID=2886944 RepID=UPI001F508218|nr:aldehyde dehydrogenase family protein [Streptomyces sp. CNQ085]MCI0387058.1 aldehyde dehydrogenase family protein [Streptomyces sp. CNQ085]